MQRFRRPEDLSLSGMSDLEARCEIETIRSRDLLRLHPELSFAGDCLYVLTADGETRQWSE